MINGSGLTPTRFDLVCRVAERASFLVGPHSTISLGAAVDAACRRLRIVLDDDSYCLVVVSLGRYRNNQQKGTS